MSHDKEIVRGSEAENCEFCPILEGVDQDSIIILGSGSATAIVSKKDGHPLVMPLMHVNGMEANQISRMAMRSAEDLAWDMFPHVQKVYKDLYGAEGYSMVANFGSHQNIPHYHIHLEAYTGSKREGTSEQITITEIHDRLIFAEAVRKSMDPEGLSTMFLEPTHKQE